MKKLIKIFGIILMLLLVAVVAIPFVVNVDQYRPQVVAKANEQINGKLELGKLGLSLWGQIKVEIAGLTLTDTAGTKLVSVSDAYFHIPFSSIFGGAPLITLHLGRPELNIIKDKVGKLNLMGLMKPQSLATPSGASGATDQGESPQTGKSTGSKTDELPAMAKNARIGFELVDATILYKDVATSLDSRIEDFNLIVKELSLSRPTEIEAWADLNTKMGKTMKLKGPFKLVMKALPTLKGLEFEKAAVQGKVTADDLEIELPGLFIKKKGMAANLEWDLIATPTQTQIQKLTANFFNAQIQMAGEVETPQSVNGVPGVIKSDLKIDSNEIDLKSWGELLPMLAQYQLTGKAKFGAAIQGPSDHLDYQANFRIQQLTAKAGNLKSQPEFNLEMNVKTNELENFLMTMKAPGNDLKVQGSVIGFDKPKAEFTVNSGSLDLDQLVDFPKTAGTQASSEGDGEGVRKSEPSSPNLADSKAKVADTGTPKERPADLDALLDPVRSNPVLAGTDFILNFNFKSIKAQGAALNALTGKIFLRQLTAGFENISTKAYDGSIGFGASLNMAPKIPTYQFNTKVQGLDIKKAVQAQFAMLKHTVYGKADFNLTGSGASLNTPAAMKNLSAKGNFKISDATFASIDVGKMVSEGLNGALAKIGDKIPAAKGKTVNGLPNKEARYESITSSFTILGGKFDMPDFFAKAESGKTVDIKGMTSVGMLDQSLKTRWEVIDTYNLTKAKDISVNQAGVNVDHIFCEGNDPVKFPVEAGCTISAPCYTYTQVPEYLAAIAIKNITRATTGKAKAEVKKKVEDAIKQHVPQNLQNPVQDLKKRLFGN